MRQLRGARLCRWLAGAEPTGYARSQSFENGVELHPIPWHGCLLVYVMSA